MYTYYISDISILMTMKIFLLNIDLGLQRLNVSRLGYIITKTYNENNSS